MKEVSTSNNLLKSACFSLVVFFTGDANSNLHKRNIYEQNGAAVCSQKRALCIATVVFASLFATSLVIAYAGPHNGECSDKLE